MIPIKNILFCEKLPGVYRKNYRLKLFLFVLLVLNKQLSDVTIFNLQLPELTIKLIGNILIKSEKLI